MNLNKCSEKQELPSESVMKQDQSPDWLYID